MTVLLLGDSHLAYLVVDHPDLLDALGGPESRAFGGAIVPDLQGQAAGLALDSYEGVVVSIGTNDRFMGEDPDRTRARLDAFLAAHPGARWTWLDSPNWPVPLDGLAPVVRTRELLAPLGPDAFVGDGVHLSRAAYEVLVPAIAAAIRPA